MRPTVFCNMLESAFVLTTLVFFQSYLCYWHGNTAPAIGQLCSYWDLPNLKNIIFLSSNAKYRISYRSLQFWGKYGQVPMPSWHTKEQAEC